MRQSINLLYPATVAVKKIKKGPDLLVVVLAAVFMLVCPALYGYLYYQDMQLTSRINELNVQVSEVSKPLPSERKSNSLIQERNSIQKAVYAVIGTRKIMSKPMDLLADLSEPEITLKSLEVRTEPERMVLNGTAPSQAALARFLGNLQQSEHYSHSFLVSSKAANKFNIRTVEFVIAIIPAEGVFK